MKMYFYAGTQKAESMTCIYIKWKIQCKFLIYQICILIILDFMQIYFDYLIVTIWFFGSIVIILNLITT